MGSFEVIKHFERASTSDQSRGVTPAILLKLGGKVMGASLLNHMGKRIIRLPEMHDSLYTPQTTHHVDLPEAIKSIPHSDLMS